MSPRLSPPPGPSGRTLEFVGGIVAAVIAGSVAYRAAEAVADDRRVKGDAGYSRAGNVAFIAGTWVGASTGVYLIHRLRVGEGSFGGALLAAALPSGLLLLGVDEPYMPLLAVVTVIPLQSLRARAGVGR